MRLKNFLMRCFLLAAALMVTACTQLGLFAANLPTHMDNIDIVRDVPFGPAPAQRLDIYMPGHVAGPYPVVIFFYGGRWEEGHKDDYRFVGSALARQGFVTVIPDYRKYPAVKFPVFVQDGAKAVAWVADHIAQYGGDPRLIAVAGHSSGAHIGALVAADSRYLKAEGKGSGVVRAFVGLSGPYAFTPEDPDLKDMFGPPSRYPQMRVTTFIDGRQPPMLLLYGDADTVVKPFNLGRVKTAIERRGGCVETKIYHGINHIWTIGALSWLGRHKAPVLQDMVDYLQRADRQEFCKKEKNRP